MTQNKISNIRSKQITIQKSPLSLDTLSIIQSSVQFFKDDKPIDNELSYSFQNDSLYLRLKNDASTTMTDSINIIYRVFPYNFGSSFSHLDSSKVLPRPEDLYIGYDFNIYEKDESDLLFSKGLEYDGSFARGLSFGNSQSLVLNSNFNLQLGGKLGEDLEILASISDANIPIQPEGTTQQLQDFDKVFIQLKRQNTTLIAGDYELERPNSYFINYYKKLQGASVLQENYLGKYGKLSQKGSVAISKGKFSRNTLSVREGNQGPYKLTGSEGERFLIVLSGTEKVYFDGRLMTRGEENDYVIYYDRAEIVFTTNRLITKDSRIIVEFEYADQKYLRSLYQYTSTYELGKFKMYFNLISQQDSKSTTGNIDLDSLDLNLLRETGDQDINAVRSGIIRNNEEYNSNKIYYKKVFSNETFDSILVFTVNPDSALYQVNFSDVGTGNGSYAIDVSVNANGRVYKFVGPGKGNYEPFIRLVAPERKQMYALRSSYQFSKEASVNLEIGMSFFDLNRLSSNDDQDNIGLTGRLEFDHQILIGKKKKWTFSPILQLESKARNFQSLNPYRNAEFNRDWNLNPENISNELLGNYGFRIKEESNLANLGYTYSSFNKSGFYNGGKHNLDAKFEKNGFKIDFKNSYLTSSSNVLRTKFARPKVEISKTFEKLNNWSIGWYGEREKNEFFENNIEDLVLGSFLYDYNKFFIRSDQMENFGIRASYNQRRDYSPSPGTFTLSTIANEFELGGNYKVKNISNASWGFTYRELEISDPSLTEETNNSTILGNFNHILRLWKGALNSSINYKVSSGQEPKLEFDFREVLPGEGDYIWIDDGDGVQQKNEFQIAPFRDQANFIRINLFNNEFIRTNNAQFTQSLRLEPKTYFRSLEKQTKFSKFLSKWSLTSNYRVDNKNKGSKSIFSLNQFSSLDTSLVSFTSLYNGIIYFNRGNPKFDFQGGIRNNTTKFVQTIGFEQRGLTEYYLRNRTALSKNLDFISIVSLGAKSLTSQFFSENDFDINFRKIEPQLTYRIGNKLRLNTNYTFERKVNEKSDLEETAVVNDFMLGVTFAQEKTSRINAEMNFAQVSYNGLPNTSLELNMLDGLKDGRNILWKIDYSKRILKNIDISISYEGRKTGENKVIHVGRAQVKSTF